MHSQVSGNTVIDHQHDAITDTIKQLKLTVDGHQGSVIDQDVILGFVSTFRRHFQAEEAILRAYDWTDLNRHILKHQELLDRLTAMGNTSIDPHQIDSFSADVFEHELVEDQEYWPIIDGREILDGDFAWSEDFEVGDKKIDAHHRALLAFLGRLDERAQKNIGIDRLAFEVEQLLLHTQHHFIEEESLLRSLGNCHRAHVRAHEHLMIELQSYLDDLKNGQLSKVDLVKHYLKPWLIGHIVGFDKPAISVIKNRSREDE